MPLFLSFVFFSFCRCCSAEPCLTSLATPLSMPACSRDYTAAEREQGLHRAILNWASESRSK